MADDRLPCCRWESITATKSDKFFCRLPAISFRPVQNASSRLTLVLWPATTTERLTTGDFIETPLLVGNSQHPNRKFVPYYGRLKRILERCKNHTRLRTACHRRLRALGPRAVFRGACVTNVA